MAPMGDTGHECEAQTSCVSVFCSLVYFYRVDLPKSLDCGEKGVWGDKRPMCPKAMTLRLCHPSLAPEAMLPIPASPY